MDATPDNSAIYVTNNLSHFVDFRATSLSEITIIGTREMQVKERIMAPDANLIQGIDFSPDGEFALVTLLRTKNLVPIVKHGSLDISSSHYHIRMEIEISSG